MAGAASGGHVNIACMDDAPSSRPAGRPSAGRVADVVLATPRPGHDARSVLVLAFVVAVIAAVVGWATTIARGDGDARVPASAAPAASSTSTRAGAAPNTSSGARVVRPRFDLGLGSIGAARTTWGTGIVRVAVANRGSAAVAGGRGIVLHLMVGGESAGTAEVDALPEGGSRTVEFELGRCPAGATTVVAVLDAGAGRPDAIAGNDMARRRVDFPC